MSHVSCLLPQKGMAILLTVILVSAIFSIGLGVFNTLFGQLLISGGVGDSELALYASDQGIDRALYRDRMLQPPPTPDGLCSPLPPSNACTVPAENAALPSGACYTMLLTKEWSALQGTTTGLIVDGQYQCGSPPRVVKRRFQVNY